MKSLDVCGVGNALVDILVRVSEPALARLGLEMGTMRLVSPEEQQALLAETEDHEPHLVSGGSVANSIVALSQLGAKTALLCSVADDKYGLFYTNECKSYGIALPNPPIINGASGTSLCIITPNAERTMRTALGASSLISGSHIHEETVEASKWIFLEGYIFSNPGTGHEAVRSAVTLAKKHGTKIALTLSESWVVESFRPLIEEVLEQSSLVFANDKEASALAGTSSLEEAFSLLAQKYKGVVITAGERGALVSYEGTTGEVPSFQCKPIDLTGAGDMFAAGFLYGIIGGINPLDAAKGGCYLASKVITQIGARLQGNITDYWREALC